MDIDIDFKDRKEILRLIRHVNASIDGKKRHPTGIYPHETTPKNPITNTALFSYKEGEKVGLVKVDFLNNSIYSKIRSRHHLKELAEKEPDWSLFEDRDFVGSLPHLKSHVEDTVEFEPRSIDELAALLALLRPGKRHLKGKPKHEIMKRIWDMDDVVEGYVFKKSHAYAYALSLIVVANLKEKEK